MEHDFTLEQMQLIFTAVSARFEEIAKLCVGYPELKESRTQYASLMGVINKVIADLRYENENKED